MLTKIDIKGLDLKIDSAVQKLCEVYNASSTSTRSVLYTLLLVNILSLIAVVNTTRWNWVGYRIEKATEAVILKRELVSKQKDTSTVDHRKEKEELRQAELLRDGEIKNKIENYQNVKVPILGNTFDINDLSIVVGISFSVLLIILRFTLTREKNNLRIALHAISERYVDDYIEDDYIQIAEKILKSNSANIRTTKEEILQAINRTRRKHHYNFLSMNEIFNLPMLEVSDNALQKTYLAKIVNRNLFYFSYFTYLAICVNDIFTATYGKGISPTHTYVSIAMSICFLTMISYLCKYCNIQKNIVNGLFKEFYNNQYSFIKSEIMLKKDKVVERIFYSITPLYRTVVHVYQFAKGSRFSSMNDDVLKN